MEYELGELLPYEQPTDYIVESTDYDDSYKTPVLTAGKSFIIGYTNETKGIYTKLPVIIFDDFTTSSQYVEFPFKVKSSAMKILSANSEVADLKYLFYKMQTIQFDSANHKRYWISQYSKIKLDLPTIAEQQRIVNRIETMFAKLDQAQEKAQAVLDSFETCKAVILHKAFTGKLTANWRKKNGVSDDSWEEKTVGEICLVKGGKRVPKGMSLVKEKNEHPYLKAGNLKFGTVIDKDMEYVPEDLLKFIKNYTVSAGDVYITNVGACIGDCGIIPDCFDGANLTENAVKLTELKCHNLYLAKQLASNLVQEQIQSKIKSATLGKLSIDNIKQLVIKLPALSEQQEIVRILDTVLEKESRAKEVAQNVLDQIALLKKTILARAFRGKL